MKKLSNFVLTLKLDTQKHQEDLLDKRLNIGRQIYNACLGESFKRYSHMKESKQYKRVSKMPKGSERNKAYNELNKAYGLTEYSLHTYVKPMQKHFKKNVDSFTAQKIATRCFRAFKKLMLHQSNRVYFKRLGELNSLEGKSNNAGIRFKDNVLIWNKLIIPVNVKDNDAYAQMALDNKVRYCRIVRRFYKDKHKYYLQLILEGTPPSKIDLKTGESKRVYGIGNVGLDIGTQTIAIASKSEVKLLELAPEVDDIEKEKKVLLRKLDRQRRANNPGNYNDDGTIKKQGNKKVVWINSCRYKRTRNQLKEIQRKQADIRKQSHNELANHILSLGSRITVETMNYKGIQAKAKETTVNEKTGRFNRKKRFGKSLANKAPSMFLTILDNKLKYNGQILLKIDTYKVKSSQYSHMDGEYTKKALSERWNHFKGFKIQRDMYSAFLIMNVKDNLKEIDRQSCFEGFDHFKNLHDKEVANIKNNNNRLICSMGI